LVNLEQQGAIRVRRGQVARLSFEGMRNQTFEGKVESVYSHDTNFLVRIDTSKLPPQVLPGMTADVAIGIQEHDDALLIPVAAMTADSVYLKRSTGGTKQVKVKTGIIDGAMAEVLSGDVHPGDRLVIQKKVGS
jgi:multidrug efflux pump subunit AcrA (membrane-fusion protein)